MKRGERPDLATTMGCGPLDELVALHEELGIFDALDALPTGRQRRGVEDDLLLRTLAVLPFLETASLSGAAAELFREPAVLLHLGWSPLQIRIGDNERPPPSGGPAAGVAFRVIPTRSATPCGGSRRRRGWTCNGSACGRCSSIDWSGAACIAIDGTGLGEGLRLVSLVCVSAERPVIVAWRLLTGSASEKGKEAAVTRSLIDQAVELGGPGCIELLLVDALYADGPLLAWLKYRHEIDTLVPIPSDREIHRDLQGLARAEMLEFRRHSYVRAIQGHKQRRTLDISAQQATTSWERLHRGGPGAWGRKPLPVGVLDLARRSDRPRRTNPGRW